MDLENGYTYRPASAHVVLLTVFFGLSVFLSAVGVWSTWSEIQLLEEVNRGLEIEESRAVFNDLRQGVIGLAQIGVFIALVITFSMWVFRANCNARGLGVQDLQFTPGWCVGWFFVPIMCWFKPCQAVQEIWKASDPDSTRPWTESESAPAINSWWLLWVLSSILGRVAGQFALRAVELDAIIRADWLILFSDLLNIPTALLALVVVRGIHARQERKNVAAPPPLEDVLQVWPAQLRTAPTVPTTVPTTVQSAVPPRVSSMPFGPNRNQ